MPMLEHALSYAARGWRVFPCQARGKAPLTEHGCKDATTDEAAIRALWARSPDANISVACGAGSGFFVLDVDVSDGKQGAESLAALEAEHGRLPLTIEGRTGTGGRHLLFAMPADGRTIGNRTNMRPGLDVRGEGGYIIVAPSIHQNGQAYELLTHHNRRPWEGGAGEERPLADPPAWLLDVIAPPKAEASPAKPRPAALTPLESPIVDRARAYLQECDPAVQGQGGHNSLLWAARALVVGFEIDEATAVHLLWSEFNPRCSPPWDHEKASDVRDFERKVREAQRTPGEKPRGWLLDELGLRGADAATLDYGRRLAEGLLASAEGEDSPPDPPAEPDAPPTPAILKPKDKPTQKIPASILNPPGLVGAVTKWITSTAVCPQPMFSLGAALVACGVLMGRKVRDSGNGRTNIYMMGVGHSSSGKDHPGKCIRALFSAAGAAHLLGGSRVTSDTAIELALEVTPSQLFTFDEMGHFIANIKQAGVGSGGAQHMRTIVPCLMELFSSAGDLYIGKQKASEELRRIAQPNACIWGLTSPDVLFESLSKKELRDGWLGRVITLISHDRPKPIMRQHQPPPEGLVKAVQAWVMLQVPPPSTAGDVAGATGCYQYEIRTRPDAMAVFEAFGTECYNTMLRCDAADDDTQYLWGKALENARRVALIVACGDCRDVSTAEITEQHARFGCDLIRYCIECFRDAIRDNLADNAFEAEKQKIVKILGKTGKTGMSKAELTRRTPSFRDRKTRDNYIAELQEAGLVVVGVNPRHPQSRTWLWKAPHGLGKEESNDE